MKIKNRFYFLQTKFQKNKEWKIKNNTIICENRFYFLQTKFQIRDSSGFKKKIKDVKGSKNYSSCEDDKQKANLVFSESTKYISTLWQQKKTRNRAFKKKRQINKPEKYSLNQKKSFKSFRLFHLDQGK